MCLQFVGIFVSLVVVRVVVDFMNWACMHGLCCFVVYANWFVDHLIACAFVCVCGMRRRC